ncbi:hypothetical protein ACROYT_G014448 [Oculina patagonica]
MERLCLRENKQHHTVICFDMVEFRQCKMSYNVDMAGVRTQVQEEMIPKVRGKDQENRKKDNRDQNNILNTKTNMKKQQGEHEQMRHRKERGRR